MGMDDALSTLKREYAEQGLDYEKALHQRAMKIRLMKEPGLELPDRAGNVAAAEAEKSMSPQTATIPQPAT